MRSTDEQRGYTKGYYRAGVRAHERLQRVIDIARGYIARLEDRDTARICQNCQRWNRGDGMNNSEGCKWGSCKADFEFSLEPRMWIDAPIGAPRKLVEGMKITTQETFGCVSWIPRR